MEHVIRWMISLPGLITLGIVLLAACVLSYARFRYVETRLNANDLRTSTTDWLTTEPEHERY